jgi:hypothetical protein
MRNPDAAGAVLPAMRPLLAFAAVLLLAGCVQPFQADQGALDAVASCRDRAATARTLYFGPGLHLGPDAPSAAGSVAGNAFSNAFLTNDLKQWLSDPVDGLWLVGNVTLELWVRSTGTPAPVVLSGPVGEGYQLFDQFGTDRSFQPSYATEYGPPLAQAGTVTHYTEALAMPKGGFVAEPGDRLRVLVTDLALDDPAGGGGHDVLFGGATPSQVRFTATCYPRLAWQSQTVVDTTVDLPANRGLLTGAVPAEQGVNVDLTSANLPQGSERVTITLQQTGDRNPLKDDVDLVLRDTKGDAVWSIGSPYSDEAGTLWADNLHALFPDGRFTVEVDSYSGVAYSGRLVVTAAAGRLP